MEQTVAQQALDKPLFTPNYLNIEYIFIKIVEYTSSIVDYLSNPHTWQTLGILSAVLTILILAVIIFSIVRLVEIQIYDKEEIEHEIHQASLRRKEREKNTNPKWHYILTLSESPNDSDWRVSIIEADLLMEEILRERGISGSTVGELLEGAKESGYVSIEDAWDAHLIRNQIAHEGSDFPLTQLETRRTIRLYQNFFEELNII